MSRRPHARRPGSTRESSSTRFKHRPLYSLCAPHPKHSDEARDAWSTRDTMRSFTVRQRAASRIENTTMAASPRLRVPWKASPGWLLRFCASSWELFIHVQVQLSCNNNNRRGALCNDAFSALNVSCLALVHSPMAKLRSHNPTDALLHVKTSTLLLSTPSISSS